MMFKFGLVVLFIFSLISFSASAADWVESDHIKARVFAEDNKFGIELQIADGWHTYYKEPGDAGISTAFDFKDSKGIVVKEVIYPPYKAMNEYGLKTNAYTGDVFFAVKAQFQKQPVVNVEITGAVCKDVCIPYTLKTSRSVAG